MKYEDLLSVIKKRRSIRRYNTDPVADEDILKVLEAARWAPSGNNTQPWEFVVVRDKNKLAQVVEIMLEQNQRLRENSINFRYTTKDYLRRISVLIFVCGDPRFKSAYPRGKADNQMAEIYRVNSDAIYMQSITSAICNILLAATSLGLGTVWITGTHESITENQLKSALDIPETLDIICCIPLGYSPDKRPSLRTPRPLENMVHHDHFDRNKWRTGDFVSRFAEDKHFRANFYKTGTSD